MQGSTELNLGLTDPAEDAQEEELQEDKDPWDDVEYLSCVGAYERAWRMSRAARPGGAGGVSTQPWKGTYKDWGRLGVRGEVERDKWEGECEEEEYKCEREVVVVSRALRARL